MSFISVDIQRSRLRKAMDKFSPRRVLLARRAIGHANVQGAIMLLNQIQAEIQREGLVDTGAYLNSWSLVLTDPVGETVTVGTNHPAARRHEYGFSGRDSLGRVYHTPPRPHVRPAMAVVRGKAFKGMQAAIRRELS
jgi:hypothetical protein